MVRNSGMEVDIIERLRADLAGAKKGAIFSRANEMRVPGTTLLKIVRGKTRNPRYSTVLAIQADYAKREA
jgi:hypothetical protein